MGRKWIAASFALLLLLAACGEEATPDGAFAGRGPGVAWAELPGSPLSARRSAQAFSLGGRLVVMGGTEAPVCPSGADCSLPTEAPQRDGAAFDPKTETWTPVAEAPVPIDHPSSAVVGDRVYLLTCDCGSEHPSVRRAFVAYDASEDAWRELALPPKEDMSLALAAASDGVIAYQSTQENGTVGDFLYDVAKDSWSELPTDPLRSSFDRTMVWTDAGLVLFGIENVPQPGADGPAFYRAAILEGDQWRRLPDSKVIGWDPVWWHLDGHVINATLETADGGEVGNWGRPYPGGGILDVATGEWAELPNAPREPGPFTGFYAGGRDAIASNNGWVFEPGSAEWHELDEPPGAPDTEAAAAWVGDTLYVWGGARYEGREGELVATGWSWQLP